MIPGEKADQRFWKWKKERWWLEGDEEKTDERWRSREEEEGLKQEQHRWETALDKEEVPRTSRVGDWECPTSHGCWPFRGLASQAACRVQMLRPGGGGWDGMPGWDAGMGWKLVQARTQAWPASGPGLLGSRDERGTLRLPGCIFPGGGIFRWQHSATRRRV